MSGHCVAQKIGSHLVVNQSSERQVVKKICEVFPHIGIAVLPKALIVEAIAATYRQPSAGCNLSDYKQQQKAKRRYDKHLHLCYLSALMIAPEDGYSLPVADFQSYQEGNSFH